MQYACKAGIAGVGARCRNMEPCPVHTDGLPPALRPDVVLFRVNIGKPGGPRNKELLGAGVRMSERTFERGVQLGQERAAAAKRLGRNAYAIRRATEGSAAIATYGESADDGSPVFGKDGLQLVSVTDVPAELKRVGFVLVDAHQLHRQYKPPVRLVLSFLSRELAGGLEHNPFPWEILSRLTGDTFKIDVWANPPKTDGKIDPEGVVIHTVNCKEPAPQARPHYHLVYAGGDWAAEPIG